MEITMPKPPADFHWEFNHFRCNSKHFQYPEHGIAVCLIHDPSGTEFAKENLFLAQSGDYRSDLYNVGEEILKEYRSSRRSNEKDVMDIVMAEIVHG